MSERAKRRPVSSGMIVSFVVLVACGPQKDDVPLRLSTHVPTRVQNAVAKCQEHIRQGRQISVGVDRENPMENIVCERPSHGLATVADRVDPFLSEPEDLTGSESEPVEANGGERTYQWSRYPIKYSVGKLGGASSQKATTGLSVAMNVGIRVPLDKRIKGERTAKAAQSMVVQIINKTCVPMMREIWKRSHAPADILVGSYLLDDSGHAVDAPIPGEASEQARIGIDQSLDLEVTTAQEALREGAQVPIYQIAGFEHHGQIWPLADDTGFRECDRVAKRQARSLSQKIKINQDCLIERGQVLSQKFCAYFNLRIGYWLGLRGQTTEEEERFCSAWQDSASQTASASLPVAASAPPAPRLGLIDSIWSSIRNSDFDLQGAGVSAFDMMTILRPACPDLIKGRTDL